MVYRYRDDILLQDNNDLFRLFIFKYLRIYCFAQHLSFTVFLRLRHRTGPHSGRCLDPGIEMVWNDLQKYPVMFRNMYQSWRIFEVICVMTGLDPM